MHRIILSILFSGSFLLSSGQTSFSVAEYKRAVAIHDYQEKIARQGAEAAFQKTRSLHADFMPRISADAGFNVDFRRSRTAGGRVEPYSFSVQSTVSQTVYAGGSVRKAYRRSQTDYEIALCAVGQSSLETVYAAEYGYWNLAADIALLDAARRYIKIVESLLEVVDSRFEDGYISKTDVLMVQARKSEAEYSLRTQERAWLVSLHNFNIQMGRAPSSDVVLADSILDISELPVRVTVDEILSRRPDYTASQLQILSDEYGVGLARSDFNPQVSVGVTGVWSTLSPNMDGSTRVDGYAFLKVSVPIFSWNKRRYNVRQAAAAVEADRLAAQSLAEQIARQESDAWSAIMKSAMQVRESYNSLSIAAENLSLSTFAYNEGQLTVLDVLSAQLSWIQIYTNTISAAASLRMAIADYHRITASELAE